jgi:hypothetical protein
MSIETNIEDKSASLDYTNPHWDNYCKSYFNINEIYPEKFHGDVLYVGMGNAYGARQHTNKVTSTTFIEKYKHIIDQCNIKDDWIIINKCAYTIELENKYDFIFMDIWAYPLPKFYKEVIEKYKKYLKLNGEFLALKSLCGKYK